MAKNTPVHSVRIADDLWKAALAKASWQGATISGIIRKCLRDYVEGEADDVRDMRD